MTAADWGVSHYRWDSLPLEDVAPKLTRRIVCGDRLMITHVYFEEGREVAWHSHENEQITYILEGTLRFWLGDDGCEPIDVSAGEILHIPSNVPHCALALEKTLDVDIFTPPRQDWLDKTDTYLRGLSV